MFFTSPQNREPAVRPYKHLLRRWQFRCEMDWNGLRPCSESRFGTKRKRSCKGNAKPSKHTITKAPCRHAAFCLQKMFFSPSHTTLLLRIIQISLSPDKQIQPATAHELSQLNSATRRADRGANVFVTEGSVTLASFDFCMFFTSPQNREPAVRPYKHLLRRWQFRCEMDWNGLRPCSESRFGTKRKRNCKGNAKPSKYTICKASQTRNFLLAKHNDENDFDSNPNASQEEEWCWSTMSPRKAVTRIRDSKVGSLRVFAWSCWKHLTKHCETTQTIRRHHYHSHAYAASLQVAHRRTKSNILRQLFWTPLKSLKNTPGTQQNLLVMEYAECLYTGKRHHCILFQCLYQHPKCIRVVLGKAAKSTGKVRWDICSMRPGMNLFTIGAHLRWKHSLNEGQIVLSMVHVVAKVGVRWPMQTNWLDWAFTLTQVPNLSNYGELLKTRFVLLRISWVLTLNILCIFEGLWLHQFWMVQAGWASLQVSETTGKRVLNDHP